jgi:hypothetical protein
VGSRDDASTGQAHVSVAFSLAPPSDSDEAFYALSSDDYWSNDEGLGHRISGLSSNLGGKLPPVPMDPVQFLAVTLNGRIAAALSMTVSARSR